MDWFNPFENSEGGGGGGSGTDNYNELLNKPSINNTTLSGNKNSDDLGLQAKIDSNHKLSSDNVSDLGAQNLFTNATEKQTWNAKQDAIQNLQDIQSGAALGATSLQPSNVKSTYSSTGTDPVNGTAVAAALGTLDVESVGGAGKYISAISETDGKISATAETMDSTPTQSSTNPVTSAGIYTDQARQDALEAQDRAALIEVVDKGAKNLLKLGFEKRTVGNQTAEMASDGNGIIVNGDRNTSSDVILVYDLVTNQSNMLDTRYTLPAGKYVIPSTGTSNLRYQVYCHDGTNYQSLGYTMSNPLEFEYTSALKAQYPYIAYRLWASRVSSFDNFTVYPMVCSKAEWDISQSYEPYALPNPSITAKMIEGVDSGCKNSLNPKNAEGYSSQSNFPITKTTGVTYTLNQDYTITATSSTEVSNATLCRIPITLPVGCYYISGSPTGGSDSSYRVDLRYSGGNTPVPDSFDYGEGFILNLSESTAIDYCMRIAAGYNNKTVTFKPMICTLADWNISHRYVPYKQDITWGFGDKIPQNSDFNSYIIPGVYRVENSTDAATMLHIPVTGGGGRLEVKGANALNRIIQTYYISTSTFTRYYNGTTWSDWAQILSTATLDEIPTANSTNAVMSGGVWTDQQRQETEIGVVANAGAKNLLQFDSLSSGTTTYTTAGVKFDILSDGSVKAERVSASTSVANIALKIGGNTVYIDNFCNGKFILSGCPSGGGNSTYELMASITGGAYTKRDYGSGVLLTDKGSYSDIYVQCTVRSSFDGTVIFKPMLRPAAITDATFQPYAKTNRELTVLTDEDRAALVELVDGGAKNLLKFESLSQDHRNGVDYTLNSDGSVTVNGTPSGTSESYVVLTIATATAFDATEFCDGKHIISGCPSGGGESSYRIQVAKSNYVVYDYGSGAVLTPTTLTGVTILIYIPNGVTANNLVFRPMICTSAAWKISKQYQPYRPSWQEMYEMIQALQNGGNRALTMQTEPEEQEER